MKGAGVDVASSSSLCECVFEDEFQSREWQIKTSSWRASSPFFDLPVKPVDKDRECGQQQNIHHPDMRYVPVNLARRTRWVHV
jgi:hypothetical protein